MSEKDNAKVLNTDLVTAIYRLAVVILLAGILVVQWQSLGNTGGAPPSEASEASEAGPTWGEMRNAQNAQERQAFNDQIPLVRVTGGPIAVIGQVKLDSTTIAQIRDGQ